MTNLRYPVVSIVSLLLLSGCNPDKVTITAYTSDLKSALDGEVVELPLKATFSIMGEDKENQLPRAKSVAIRYLPKDSAIEIAKGTYGKVMTVVTSIPIGSKVALKKYLEKNHRISMIEVKNNTVKFLPTDMLRKMNKELSKISFMLSVKLPANHLIFNVIGDSKEKMNLSAIAIFSEKKPYLQFSKDVKKRKSVEIEFKGTGGSVYNEIAPQFLVKF